MEAMTQEFMLHRRPHVEIWSAREGSDDDNDSLHRQPWTLKGFISGTKSLMDPKPTKMLLQQQTADSIPQNFSSSTLNYSISHPFQKSLKMISN